MSRFYLLFDRIEISAANALSGPLSYGFPAISGFVGAVHRLARGIPEDSPITLGGVLIASHRCDVRTFQADRWSDKTFIQTRNPIKKDGKTAAIIEEGKVDLTVSLVIEVDGDYNTIVKNQTELSDKLRQRLFQQRIAGGSVEKIAAVGWFSPETLTDLARLLTPAFILTHASDEMAAIVAELRTGMVHKFDNYEEEVRLLSPETPTGLPANPEATALDAILATAAIYRIPPQNEEMTQWTHYSVKRGRGWLVPIAIGYQGIRDPFPPGGIAHLRNPQYPAQYVETLYSLGRWEFALSFSGRPDQPSQLSDHFWRYQPSANDLYLFTTEAN